MSYLAVTVVVHPCGDRESGGRGGDGGVEGG